MNLEPLFERIIKNVAQAPSQLVYYYSIHNNIVSEIYGLGIQEGYICATEFIIVKNGTLELGRNWTLGGKIFVDVVWLNKDGTINHLFQIEKLPLAKSAKENRNFLKNKKFPTIYVYFQRKENNWVITYECIDEPKKLDEEV